MIIPSRCPKCNDILVNEFNLNHSTKSCSKRLDHKFYIRLDHEELTIIKYTSKTEICWDFRTREILIGSYIALKGRSVGATTMTPNYNYHCDTVIPWFEPDFSDFPRLMKKIKTYILFS